jgi:hypothetical protein
MMRHVLRTQGDVYGGRLYVNDRVSMCGNIEDGVSANWTPDVGGFVINFSDLEKLYIAAKKYRLGDKECPTCQRLY